MGMANSDDEEQIRRDHDMIETYKKACPWDVPKRDASETEVAMWEEKVKRTMTRPDYNDGRG